MVDFPDIPTPPELLKEKARIDKLVVFIGAGVSRLVGCPSWDGLAHKYLEHLWEHSKRQPSGKDPLLSFYEYGQLKAMPPRRLLSICSALFDHHKIDRPLLKDICRYNEKFNKTKVFNYLRDFHAIYVTTNYDTCLEDARPSVDSIESGGIGTGSPRVETLSPTLRVFSNIEELLTSRLEQDTLLHLHGDIREDRKAVITFEDYLKHYKDGQNPSELLKDLFVEDYAVLFIGYGMEEFEILEYLVSRPKTGTMVNKNIFMLLPVLRQQKMVRFFDAYYKSMGIKILPYAIDDKGYDQLEAVLDTWSREFKKITHNKSYIEGLKLIDKAIEC